MESLVTDISCSLKLTGHQQNASIPAINTSVTLLSSPSSKPSTTSSLLNADKSTASVSPLLPLPPSRSLIPSSLKFLWFGKDNPASTAPNNASDNPPPIHGDGAHMMTDDDPKAEAHGKHHCTCSDSSNRVNHSESEFELGITDGNVSNQSKLPSASPHDKGWVSWFLRLNLLWKASDSKLSSEELVESALIMAADQQVWNGGGDGINGRDVLDGNSCTTTGLPDNSACALEEDGGKLQETCMVEAGHERVVHDRDSISMFLHEVPIAEVQAILKLCLLSNLAYIIPEVQRKDLLKEHNMSFVTSSFIKKEAEAKASSERSSALSVRKQKSRVDKRKSRSKALDEGALLDRSSTLQVQDGDPYVVGSSPNALVCLGEVPLSNADPSLAPQERGPEVSSSNHEGLNLEESINKTAKDSKEAMQGTCPCEWFICDDKASSIRYLVIQGSESLASWQTNLSFDPTKFEGLGVLVHRGIYEAAHGLYNMVLREMEEHVRSGPHAKVCFTGHSLGGSLATLLAMMLVRRGIVKAEAVDPVVTLGAPCVLCAGDQRRLLARLGLRRSQFLNVVMHRDIVPRAFACDYPEHVARVLKRINATFRDHPCLNHQHLLYAPVGQVMILQPHESQSPSHPLLPAMAGLFLIKHPLMSQSEEGEDIREEQAAMEERDAHRAFFNSPHPLEMLRDPGAYGFEGAISRDHDPRSYKKAVRTVILQGLQRLRHSRKQLVIIETSSLAHKGPSSSTNPTFPTGLGGHDSLIPTLKRSSPIMRRHVAPYASPSPKTHVVNCYARLIASRHIHMGLLFILSIASNVFSSLLSWG